MAQEPTTATPEPELGTSWLRPSLTAVSNWSARETLWTVDVFARMFATIVVFRTVSQLVSHWWFSKAVWEATPSLVRGFQPPPGPGRTSSETVEGTVEDDSPELLMTSEGERFYHHETYHAGQYWACPLLRPDRCRDCAWFVEDATAQPRCAAVTKLALRHHLHYRHFSLDEIRTLLERGRPGAFA